MEVFIREASTHVAKNPPIAILPMRIYWDQGEMAVIEGKPQQAIPLLEKALAYGDNAGVLLSLAEAYEAAGDYPNAWAAAGRCQAMDPDLDHLHALRGGILLSL